MLGSSSLADLPRLRDARRRRASSYDTTGGNADRWLLQPGETRTLMHADGPGCVRHVWMTLASREEAYPRRSVLRMYWDSAPTPCVEVPTGDFFGIGHGMIKEFWSLPLTMSPQDGRGFNCYFPMPFATGARIDLTNDGERQIVADTRHAHPGTDIRAVLDGYVSISPLATALANEEHIRQLESSAEALAAALR